MKKMFLILLLIAIVIITFIIYNYNGYKAQTQEIQKLNEEYENYATGEIVGTSLITLINKTVDINKKNNILVDNNGIFIQNDENSIRIDVKFLESEDIFPMEKIENMGSASFTKNYASALFKCTQKEYHKNSNLIKYLLFEEIS